MSWLRSDRKLPPPKKAWKSFISMIKSTLHHLRKSKAFQKTTHRSVAIRSIHHPLFSLERHKNHENHHHHHHHQGQEAQIGLDDIGSVIPPGPITVTWKYFSTTKANADVNIFRAGELALCSITLVAGLYILMRSATKITHKAQSITCLASKWHVCATIDSFDAAEAETPMAQVAFGRVLLADVTSDGDADDAGDEEDELDNTKLIPAYACSTISFQKRQALVTYFENNRAGITVYGFMMDRTYIHTVFGIELSRVLWLLGKTIGIS